MELLRFSNYSRKAKAAMYITCLTGALTGAGFAANDAVHDTIHHVVSEGDQFPYERAMAESATAVALVGFAYAEGLELVRMRRAQNLENQAREDRELLETFEAQFAE